MTVVLQHVRVVAFLTATADKKAAGAIVAQIALQVECAPDVVILHRRRGAVPAGQHLHIVPACPKPGGHFMTVFFVSTQIVRGIEAGYEQETHSSLSHRNRFRS